MPVVNVRTATAATYIGRGSEWGNPYVIGKDGNRDQVIAKYELDIRAKLTARGGVATLTKRKLRSLHGKTLGCYCAPKKCHGDVLEYYSAWAVTNPVAINLPPEKFQPIKKVCGNEYTHTQ
jgi:hypothetical protein